MLDYKAILVDKYALGMNSRDIAAKHKCSKSGINDFLCAFKKCKDLGFPLPQGITNEGIHSAVYGSRPTEKGKRFPGYEYPDFESINRALKRQNMTLIYQWGLYARACGESRVKAYSYRQFCDLYRVWCDENGTTSHFDHQPGQAMEVDFAGKTFHLVDPIDGEMRDIVVFVAVLPYSQYIYAEGMTSTKEPQWIEVNDNALEFFRGVPQIVVCDNCKQAVVANRDWVDPELNQDYAEWAEHYGTAIMPAKVRKPKYKPSVEGAVGIMEKGFFHDLDAIPWHSIEDFNGALWRRLAALNSKPFEKKEHSRSYYFEEERKWLLPLPEARYEYAERKEATVSSDFHISFDKAYYSCPCRLAHQRVLVRATASQVTISDRNGAFICRHDRAKRRGEWVTDPSHLPINPGEDYRDWSPAFFERKAALIGSNTSEAIARILASRKHQVQTFRYCCGVLSLEKKYGKETLESACELAVKAGKTNYTYIKNTVHFLGERAGKSGRPSKGRNENAYLAKSTPSVDELIAKTGEMIGSKGGEGDE